MAEKIRIGLTGMGSMMHAHVRDFEKMPDVWMAAMADPDGKHRSAYKERYPCLRQVPEYDDHRVMFDKEQLTGVVIASPQTEL